MGKPSEPLEISGRYWFFYTYPYYPAGGMEDFEFSFNTYREFLGNERVKSLTQKCSWHILDSRSGNIYHDYDEMKEEMHGKK